MLNDTKIQLISIWACDKTIFTCCCCWWTQHDNGLIKNATVLPAGIELAKIVPRFCCCYLLVISQSDNFPSSHLCESAFMNNLFSSTSSSAIGLSFFHCAAFYVSLNFSHLPTICFTFFISSAHKMEEKLALKELFMQFCRVTQSLAKHHNFTFCVLYQQKKVFCLKSFRALVADAYLEIQRYLLWKKWNEAKACIKFHLENCIHKLEPRRKRRWVFRKVKTSELSYLTAQFRRFWNDSTVWKSQYCWNLID